MQHSVYIKILCLVNIIRLHFFCCLLVHMMTREATVQGVSDLWEHVNHIAIVVSDVGRSLAFYTHVVGMTQVMRPNFDRYRRVTII